LQPTDDPTLTAACSRSASKRARERARAGYGRLKAIASQSDNLSHPGRKMGAKIVR